MTEYNQQMIQNPILPGFNPDPCIARKGDDFYIATSTFEWFGGVQIYHSKDLKNWRIIGMALNRTSQIDLRGDPSSGGVWAPCLTYADGCFWLVYSDVKQRGRGFKDVHNYVVWTEDIESNEWSEPHYLNSSGFDPSLFHDDNGKKYVTNMLVDHRPGKNRFAGILVQEYDHEVGIVVGPVKNVWPGTKNKGTEGPHIYQKDGYYYMLVAEGGTGRHHCASVARSKSIWGPYEEHPSNPIMTARHDLGITLQKSGHGSWIEATANEWYMVHLCSRPQAGYSILGRETAIQKLRWDDNGWPYLVGDGDHIVKEPQNIVPAPSLPQHPFPALPNAHDFTQIASIPPEFMTLRIPADESWLNFNNGLVLNGQESLASTHRTSVLARRIQHHSSRTETCVDCSPRDFQHMAGLVAMYDNANWLYFHVTRNDDGSRILRMGIMDQATYREAGHFLTQLSDEGAVELACEIEQLRARFFYRLAGDDAWIAMPNDLPAELLSDEYGEHKFTGAFVGVACQDQSGQRAPATFTRFSYTSL